jgi:DNA primase large subunit
MSEEKKQGGEIMEELEALGQQLTSALRALWESEDSRNFRQEIGDGFAELGRQLDVAFKSAQESEAAKEFSEQVKETMDKARESDVAGKIERSLLSGLRELNEQLSKTVSSLQEEGAGEPPEDQA